MRGNRLPPNGRPADLSSGKSGYIYRCPVCNAEYETLGEASQCQSLHRIADAAENGKRCSREVDGSSHGASSGSDSSSSNMGCIFWAVITVIAFLYYGGGCGSGKKAASDGKASSNAVREEKRVNQHQRPLSVGKCVLTSDSEKSIVYCEGTAGKMVDNKVQVVDLKPTLCFRRKNGNDALYIAFKRVIAKSDVEVSHYVGETKIMRDSWSVSTDGAALFYEGDSLALAKRIAQEESYTCIFRWNGSGLTLVFDAVGWGDLLGKM